MSTEERQLINSRTFVAPRSRVFNAWTSPEVIGQWWGPDGFTTTTHHMDFRPGGEWQYIMHGPDGTDYPNYIRYREITEPVRIEYDHGEYPDEPFHFSVTVMFEEVDGKTVLTQRLVFPDKESRDKTVDFGAIEGGKQTLNRLELYLQKETG
jgi:uncharacterized protein YndB with AHSA1/START domain